MARKRQAWIDDEIRDVEVEDRNGSLTLVRDQETDKVDWLSDFEFAD